MITVIYLEISKTYFRTFKKRVKVFQEKMKTILKKKIKK